MRTTSTELLKVFMTHPSLLPMITGEARMADFRQVKLTVIEGIRLEIEISQYVRERRLRPYDTEVRFWQKLSGHNLFQNTEIDNIYLLNFIRLKRNVAYYKFPQK